MSEKKLTILGKNLEFFRKRLHLSKEQFAEGGKEVQEDKEVQKGIGINVKTYTSLLYNDVTRGEVRPQTLNALYNSLVTIINDHEELKKLFPNLPTLEELINEDVQDIINKDGAHIFNIYYHKFEGVYLCYYMSTNIEGARKNQYGIMNLTHNSNGVEFEANGIFSINSLDIALDLFKKYQETGDFPADTSTAIETSLFRGKAYLSPTLLWVNMSNDSKSEHVSMSFDISYKVATKHAEKKFIGALGIALAQTSGQFNQTTTFPIIVSKQELPLSPNEIANQLHFNYTRLSESDIDKMADKTMGLINSLLTVNNIDETLMRQLIAQIVEHEVKDLLRRHTFNAHYFTSDETSEFYKNVIRPLRKTSK